MERFIIKDLLAWKNSSDRKPLILRGARQVGKTYILKEFGKREYKNTAYFNFDHADNLKKFFEATRDSDRLLEQLILASNQKIEPENTLIIFDEIQECPDALTSLKYFCEDKPNYHIACAGSLLGVKFSSASFPVGKVDFLDMYPMSFSEFLLADGAENLVDAMRKTTLSDPLSNLFSDQLLEKLRTYFVIGGMPAVVKTWVKNRDIRAVNRDQSNILRAYENDFSKHTTKTEANRISLVWNGIPSQLARDNKKFIYQAMRPGARAREYESALTWLGNAGLIIKCPLVTKCAIPLRAYQDLSSFKVYFNDVGLLRQKSGLESDIITEGNLLFQEFKGALTENYVLSALRYHYGESIFYYTFNSYEIDFVIQRRNQIVPIEVKSGTSNHHRSLTKFNAQNNNQIAIRFSPDNLKRDGKIVNIPLYLVEYIDNLKFEDNSPSTSS